MAAFLTTVVLICCGLISGVSSYCMGYGGNPGFSDSPTVQQVSMTSVLVSWRGIVTQKDCADQFLVKSWDYMDPNNYQISELLSTDKTSYVVKDLTPQKEYVFQVVAREDKGFLGKDWNKSPPVKYTTRRGNPTVDVPGHSVQTRVPVPNLHSGLNVGEAGDDGRQYVTKDEEENADETPVSLVIILFISSAIVIITIIVSGAIYNMMKMARKKRRQDDSESSSSSSLDLAMTSENLVSWRQSRRDLLESTRVLAMTAKQSKVSLASSMIDLTAQQNRKLSTMAAAEAVESDAAKSRAASLERKSQGTQTPRTLYTPASPCCECSLSPATDRRRPTASHASTDAGANDAELEFIDSSGGAALYSPVLKRTLERISDHPDEEEGEEEDQ